MTGLMRRLAWVCLVGSAVGTIGATLEAPVYHQGMCDASAAVALNDNLFVVGDDEDNALRVYPGRHPGPPLHAIDVSVFLGLKRRAEVDIEACARSGDRIYWLSSHGTNVKGKKRLARQRFFATHGSVRDGIVNVQPIGRPYVNLLQDLVREPRLAQFGLAAAANRPPKTPGALSIEGLAGTSAGYLLIGFRNPIPQGRALVVPLLNPGDLIEGRRSRFGDPILIDLGGLGIRSLEQWGERYLIVGGTRDGQGDSWLYEWDGRSASARRRADLAFGDINPEAITVCADKGDRVELLVMSDDGTVEIDGVPCKRLKDPGARHFRSVIAHLSAAEEPEPPSASSPAQKH